jgi:transcriptional regulator with XRE-family HTH domain
MMDIMADQQRNELGTFLRARRAVLSPEETGVSTFGKERRVPGLRREEVALLAGVSVKYYTRLEQGQSHQVSDSVLEAIAGALRLDESGRRYLARLAWPTHLTRRHDSGPETARDSLKALAEGTTDRAALILGRHMDLLGGNRLGYALFGLRPGQEVNIFSLIFLDPVVRDLFVDWETEARNHAAFLREATGSQPDDPRLAELIGPLSIESRDFVRIWAEHPVAECGHNVHQYNHPLVGLLTLTTETLSVPDDPGQQISFQSPEPGSDSAERLRLLDSLVA